MANLALLLLSINCRPHPSASWPNMKVNLCNGYLSGVAGLWFVFLRSNREDRHTNTQVPVWAGLFDVFMIRACSLRNCSISDLRSRMKTDKKQYIWPLSDKVYRSTNGWRRLEGGAGRLEIGRNVTTTHRGGDLRRRIVWKWRARSHFEISHMLRFSSWETFLCSSWLCALQVLILELMITEEQGQVAQLLFPGYEKDIR